MGLTPNVVANTPIASAWGNEIRDRSVQNFATATERSAQWITPPEGALSYLRDVDRVEVFIGAWVPISAADAGALGEVGFWRQTSDVGLPGGAPVRLNVGAMAALRPNRTYRATFTGQVSYTATANTNLQLRVGTTPGANPAAQTVVQRHAFSGGAGTFMTHTMIARWQQGALAAGSYEVALWGGTSAAATIVQGTGAFTDIIVEDIGGT